MVLLFMGVRLCNVGVPLVFRDVSLVFSGVLLFRQCSGVSACSIVPCSRVPGFIVCQKIPLKGDIIFPSLNPAPSIG